MISPIVEKMSAGTSPVKKGAHWKERKQKAGTVVVACMKCHRVMERRGFGRHENSLGCIVGESQLRMATWHYEPLNGWQLALALKKGFPVIWALASIKRSFPRVRLNLGGDGTTFTVADGAPKTGRMTKAEVLAKPFTHQQNLHYCRWLWLVRGRGANPIDFATMLQLTHQLNSVDKAREGLFNLAAALTEAASTQATTFPIQSNSPSESGRSGSRPDAPQDQAPWTGVLLPCS